MSREEEFSELRPMLFAIAYRILGSVSEAEDAVQETWVRFQTSATEPRSTKSFLSAVVTRLSIDVLRSARVSARRMSATGSPNRSSTTRTTTPSAPPSWRTPCRWRRCSCSSGSVRSSGRCSCSVRFSRSTSATSPRLSAGPRTPAGSSPYAQLVSDSGGKAPQWAKGAFGADNVARLLGAFLPWLDDIDVTIERHELNGQPGAIFRDREGLVLNTWTVDVLDGRIQAIRTVLNPEKLGHVGPVADAYAVLHEASEARRHNR